MITWIQTVLQKHHKSVFSVLLVAIVIAFVFTIGSVPFFGDSRSSFGEKKNKDFYGFDLSNEAVVARLQNAAYFEMILEGQQPRTQEQFTQVMLRQAYLRSLADKLGITRVSQDELNAYIQKSPLFAGADGKYSPEIFKKFVDSRLASGRMTEAYLSEVLSENALVAKVAEQSQKRRPKPMLVSRFCKASHRILRGLEDRLQCLFS